MTDCGQSNQSGRSPKNKKNTVSKFFKRLSLSKKQEDELSHPSTPSPEEKGTSTEGSTTTTHVNISYAPVVQPDSLSESYYAAPQVSPAASRVVPPDQSLQAKQHRLLRRLHSTLNEATVIVEEFLLLYKPDD
ncbi:GSCOCT00014252001.2-RA-CDS [Cotesia congregata]|uniref:Cc_serrich.2_29.7 n=2 Tax=root TaxID=1 RepID=S6D4R5_COTCN|nr:GSCOCT00014252001.2-RA-CDS [Cotesia congregata]CAG5092411.1 cc_serrich.2_29.7 [Cotesia congregata]CCB96425.1 hypothetical protein SER-RICH2 [Bracoviriform congregatae]CCQ71176.1 hypothetical protein SER-RICH2 [Cotesia congregata]